jgi:cellulose synthase/poly-beta-1,6-N-acetylglucosamine synthase-like glycosyltransferase
VTWPNLQPALLAMVEPVALAIIATGLLQNLLYLVQLWLAFGALRAEPPVTAIGPLWRRYADAAPPVCLLAPAYNEELTIVESVRSLLALQYSKYEIVVVNDGSRDGTLQALIDAFDLRPVQRDYELAVPHKPIRGLYCAGNQPRLLVVDKENGGKADALNAAINLSRAPIVCSIDADSLIEPDALLRAVRPFVEDPERTIAAGGTVRIANGCRIDHGRVLAVGLPRSPLALLQTIEYLRAFLMARLAWSRLDSLMIISGAFGLFRRQAVIAVGGYSVGTVGEDMELVVKLHRWFRDARIPYRVAFIPEPVCWTEAPETLAVLARQRARWHRGSLETFWKHRDMLFNPRYGRIGWIAFGHILLVDVLGPIVEALGYLIVPALWAAGLLSFDHLLAFLAVSFAFGMAISVGSLVLEEAELRRFPRARDLLILTAAAIAENLGYRQLNNVWRLWGTWQFLRGSHSWGTMTRKGFSGQPAGALSAP